MLVRRRLDAIAVTMLVATSLAVQASEEPSEDGRPRRLSAAYHQAQFTEISASNAGQYRTRLFQHGYLVTSGFPAAQPGPVVSVSGRDGRSERIIRAWIPGADSVAIGALTVSPAGSVVVAGGAAMQNGTMANFVASAGHGSGLTQVLRTSPFVPNFVCATDDDTVWAFGFERNPEDERRAKSEYPMLRQYSLKRGLLNQTLNRGSMTLDHYPVRGRYPYDVWLGCTPSKVVLYSGPTAEWIEYEIKTGKLSRFSIAVLSPSVTVTGLALTDSGRVFASFHDSQGDHARVGIFELVEPADKGGVRRWVALEYGVSSSANKGDVFWPIFLGSEGEAVVYLAQPDPATVLWSKVE